MLLERGDTKAFRDQRRCGGERDKVRKCVNKDITAMEERENYTSLQELTDQSTTEGNRPILERSNGILSVNVTKIQRDFMW